MSRSRVDRQTLAFARMVENLAVLLPELDDHVRRELLVLDGFADHTMAATVSQELVRRSPVLLGACAADIPDGDDLVSCGRRRPCAEHDTPVTLTGPERAAEARLGLQRWHADIHQAITTAAALIHEATSNTRRLLGERMPVADRCTGGLGREGHIDWGDPTCTRVPERAGGLCHACGMRERRWREKHDLPMRERGVA
jgi:hypothetical protein